MKEKQIEELLTTLSKKQLIQFGISCIERHIPLYKKFEDSIKLPKSKNYNAILSIVDFIKNDISSAGKDEIKAQMKKCDRICNYLDEEVEEYTQFSLVCAIYNVLTFHLKEDIEYMDVCVSDCVEIINQSKSEEYTKKNPESSDEEISKYADYCIEQELQIMYDNIRLIKKEFQDTDAPFVSKPAKIKEIKKKTHQTKRLSAKEFMLQFDPLEKILKIGFGQYFYAVKEQIKISEEFTTVNLTDIKNLQINEEKRTAEFDAFFKKTETHFIIKEIHTGTLDIMNFILSYNKKPFKINTKYKDEISMTIDKDGSYISLGRPGHEKSIHLANYKKNSFIQIYSPLPHRRFTILSYKLNETGLSIIHNGTDSCTNETVESCEYKWSFDIQPEMKKVLLQYIQVAISKYNKP